MQGLVEIVNGFTLDDAKFVHDKCNWSAAKNWASWWMRPAHLQMLHRDFTLMAEEVWSRCPDNTNAVERKNRDSKDCVPVSIQQAMVNLYKLDKSYVAKYLAAVGGSAISYNQRTTGAKSVAAETRRIQRQQFTSGDKQVPLGPPDKACHFKSGRKR